MIVRELDLDLDAFEGPFDLLLTLVLKEELDLYDVDVAAIVVSFLERLSLRTSASPVEVDVPELDLEACGEFLVLVSALLELKARGLFPEEAAELAELEPEAAAEELARRLAEYRRMKEAASWLRERLATEGDRFFRLGPAPLAPKAELRLVPQEPEQLAAVLRALAVEPPPVSLNHMALRFPPVSQFLARFRAVLQRRSRFDFDAEVRALTRVEQAVAFLALLDLRRTGEATIDQARPFAPIRVTRTTAGSAAGVSAGSVAGQAIDARPGSRAASGASAGSVAGQAIDARPGTRGASGASAGSVAGEAVDARPGSRAASGVTGKENRNRDERTVAWTARSA